MTEYIDKGKLIDYFKDAYGGGIGKTVFLTLEEAERALEEYNG